MRNIQVIDGAINSEYAIFSVEDDQFKLLFPVDGQDIEFIEDVEQRLSQSQMNRALEGVWTRKIEKYSVQGIHGTLFYELTEKKKFYPNKRSGDLDLVIRNQD